METTRIGLIGCGRVAGLRHLPALAGLPEANVIAVADEHTEPRRDVPEASPASSWLVLPVPAPEIEDETAADLYQARRRRREANLGPRPERQ